MEVLSVLIVLSKKLAKVQMANTAPTTYNGCLEVHLNQVHNSVDQFDTLHGSQIWGELWIQSRQIFQCSNIVVMSNKILVIYAPRIRLVQTKIMAYESRAASI